MTGSPISLHDIDGCPPLPLEIDDEYINTEGYLPQPPGRVSYMTGFALISNVFRILYECMMRQRIFETMPTMGADRVMLRIWVNEAQSRLKRLLGSAPTALIPGMDEQQDDVFGTQRANILVTALCTDFALVSD
jgi:hypothetical protein